MTPLSRKNIEKLQEELVKNLTVDFFEEDEIASILDEIASFDHRLRQKILALCRVLSGASSSFVPNTLKRINAASRSLSFKDLERWVSEAFDILDSEGFDSFVQFTSKTDRETLLEFQNPKGLRLQDVSPVLEAFLRAVSGRDLRIKPGEYSYTDTSSVFLPEHMNRFKENRKNFLLYKISIVHKWAQISQGTLNPDKQSLITFLQDRSVPHPDISTFFSLFPEQNLALDLYNLLESLRFDSFLYAEFPGLMKRTEKIRSQLFDDRPRLSSLSEKTAVVEGLYQYYLKGKVQGPMPSGLRVVLEQVPFQQALGPEQSMHVLVKIYPLVSSLEGDYQLKVIPAYLGRIVPEKVSRQLHNQRQAQLSKFKALISEVIDMPDLAFEKRSRADAAGHKTAADPRKKYLLIKGRLLEADETVIGLLEEEGGIAGGTLVEGSALGGQKIYTLAGMVPDTADIEAAERRKSIRYDEWDFRRGGYKKNWCSLFEHDIHPGHEPFVELTLQRYGGYVNILRKRFELLKREPKMLRRQKEGDHVDLDATVEAFADIHAGLAPTENLFMRLDRAERNIAVLFLLDMSGSTKGWVNRAEKESLVLMCEALEALGDRYAIYGFSGMTRTRCDFFRIKGFDEGYTEDIKKRIAGILPKDYTRMGPPIRHSTSLLACLEARLKMLITMSDGKPEDWDAYKGEYGIEDTRQALIEAREKGVHSFCITIDKEASTYLPHMYGEGNYIVIDDVSKLPNKITEIYRRLTT